MRRCSHDHYWHHRPHRAGKTTALREIEKLGGAVIDCDAVYHDLLERDITLQGMLESAFGPLRDESGSVDRKKLGTIVFGDPEKLEKLNTIAQTATVERTRQLLEEYRANGRTLVAIDAIALLESSLAKLCDATIAVIAPQEVRVQRIMAREAFRRNTPGPGSRPRRATTTLPKAATIPYIMIVPRRKNLRFGPRTLVESILQEHIQ